MNGNEPVEALDLGDAVIETKGTLMTGKVDVGAGFHWSGGLADED